jgi:hypothetical protein
MSSTPEIHDPTPSFQFDNISLTTPASIAGGAHFSKIFVNRTPLYIQTPKCFTKNGIIGSGRKMYTDLVFTNDNEEIIQWMEVFESTIRRKIYDNRGRWFDTEMSEDDIEGCFSPMVKLFRSGKQYCVRVGINSRPDAKPLKIYDEDEMVVEVSQINDKTPLIAILEIQGVRCTSKSFCIDIEMKQLMVMKPSDLFDSCIILKGRQGSSTNGGNRINDVKTTSSTLINNNRSDDTANLLITTSLVTDQKHELVLDPPLDKDSLLATDPPLTKDSLLVADPILVVDPHLTEDPPLVADPPLDKDPSKNDLEYLAKNDDSRIVIYTPSTTNLIQSSEPLPNNGEDYLGLSGSDDILEVDLNVDQIDQADTFQLRDKKEVYYEMYREALQKAKGAKAMALTSFMEARRIKNLYMLNDLNDSDEESDLDDLDDLDDDNDE